MRKFLVRMTIVAPALAVLIGCGSPRDTTLPEPRPVDVPAGPGSAQPFVAAADDRVVLSWTEADGDGHALRFASWDGAAWSEPGTAARGVDWFVNWADFPSVVPLPDGTLAAHWLQRSGPGRYAYDVVLAVSGDGGGSWTQPVRPHRDGTETEHGFVSLFRHEAAAGVVWLDGRQFEGGEHGAASNEMQLRFATLHGDGGTGTEHVLDDRVCDCCQTAVAVTGRGPVVFYRDRLPGEIRDISVTRLTEGAWSEPRRVHDDNWEINACPVNGPAADASGDDVVVAWFTAADQTPRVRVAFSDDAGETFGPAITGDDGHPIGRVDVLFLDGGDALLVWLERVGEDAEIRGRIVGRDGTAGPARPLAAVTAGRAGGFPRMARRGGDVLLAWTEPGEPSRIRAAVLPLSGR